MTYNLMLGFLLPLGLGIFFHRKNQMVMLLIVPFTSVVSHPVNTLIFNLNF